MFDCICLLSNSRLTRLDCHSARSKALSVYAEFEVGACMDVLISPGLD